MCVAVFMFSFGSVVASDQLVSSSARVLVAQSGLGFNYDQNNTDSGGRTGSVRDFPELINFAMNTINDIIILIIALGVVWVVYLAFMLIKAEGDKKEEARNSIIYGIVGIFVMVSIWGLVNIFVNTFKLNNEDVPTPPTLGV